MPQKIDYDALAAQARGQSAAPVDYDSLAVQARSNPDRPAGLPPGVNLPGLPAHAPAPAGMTAAAPISDAQVLSTPASRVFGNRPISDTAGNAWQHAKNLVAGPYHAFADPATAEESADIQRLGGTPDAIGRAEYRMLIKPTVEGLRSAKEQYKKGNIAPLHNYDAQGNYNPSVLSSVEDAVPLVGPWARGFINDTQQKGLVPAAAGLATDIYAPSLAKNGVGVGLYAAGVVPEGVGTSAAYVSATPEARRLYNTRDFVKGDAGDVKGQPVTGVARFGNAVEKAKDTNQQWYKSLYAPYESFNGTEPSISPMVDASPVADAQMRSMPIMDQIDSPTIREVQNAPEAFTSPSAQSRIADNKNGIFNKTENVSDNYRYEYPVFDLDQVRQDSNGKLNYFYNKAGGDQAAALSNPETARIKAVGDSTRDVLYGKLARDNGLDPQAIHDSQNEFGKLSDMADMSGKREAQVARHDPVSLPEKIAISHSNPVSGVMNWGSQHWINGTTDANALINSVFDRYNNPMGTPLVARPGLMPRTFNEGGRAIAKAGFAMKDAGRGLFKAPIRATAYSALNPPRKNSK